MNKIYDKLLLAVALLALLGGIGFFVMNRGGLPAALSTATFQPGANPYEPLPRPESSMVDVIWPEAQEQEPGVRYDVFTPPEIYIDGKGQFVFKDPSPKINKPTDELYLAVLEREPYRLQLDGYIEEDLNDATKSLILFYDNEREQSVRARIGQTKAAAEFEVLDFDIQKNRDAFGNVEKIVTAEIKDLRTGETKTLTHGERLYNDAVTIVVRSAKDSSLEFTLEAVGDSFETEIGKYRLEEINLEDQSITVEKEATEDDEAEVLVLALTESNPTKEEVPQESETDDSDAFFDAFL